MAEDDQNTIIEGACEDFETCCSGMANATGFSKDEIQEAYEYNPARLTTLYNKYASKSGEPKVESYIVGVGAYLAFVGSGFGAMFTDDLLIFSKCVAVMTAITGGVCLRSSSIEKMHKEVTDEVIEQVNFHQRQKHYGNTPD